MKRLLFVSPRFLFPLDEGGKIRTVGILRAMKGGAFAVTLASPAPPDPSPYRAQIESISDRFVTWPQRRETRLERLLAVAGPLPASVASDRSAAGTRAIADVLRERPDVTVVDFPHAAVLTPDLSATRSVIFTHNVEAEILERRAAVATGLNRHIWQREARKMDRYEGDTLRRFNSVIAVSARDANLLAARFGLAHVDAIDTGVDLDFYTFGEPRAAADTIVFTGAMDSRSNIDGIEFLMDEVWPIVAAARPDARMKIVGRNPPPALVARNLPGWSFTGFVDDVRPHMRAGDVSVIPLRVGSGTRLKAFEAMALGLPVVSTPLGIEGLSVEPEMHFVAAESGEDFARAILRVLDDAPLRRRLARNARALLEARFSWAQVGRQFEAICLRTAER